MRKIDINEDDFVRAYRRDVDYEDLYQQSTYLDLNTGHVLWVYDDDEDASFDLGIPAEENKEHREHIESEPDNFLEISGYSHGGHHGLLQEFIDSDWTSDEQEKSKARKAYFGSIGGWKKTLIESEDYYIIDCFYHFRDLKVRQSAKDFLLKNNIDPGWE